VTKAKPQLLKGPLPPKGDKLGVPTPRQDKALTDKPKGGGK
jgi:hypothetical protein